MPLKLTVKDKTIFEFEEVRSLVFVMVMATFCIVSVAAAILAIFGKNLLLPTEFLTVVSFIVGYYFGKSKDGNGNSENGKENGDEKPALPVTPVADKPDAKG